jgi:hypothetical protein
VGVPRALKNGVNKERPLQIGPSKLPGMSIYREVSSIKVNASLINAVFVNSTCMFTADSFMFIDEVTAYINKPGIERY